MFSRFGLRFRMAVSYVLVSAAAVLLVETVLLAATVAQIRAADQAALQAQQRAAAAEADVNRVKTNSLALVTANAESNDASDAAARAPGRPDEVLLTEAATNGVGETAPPKASEGPAVGSAFEDVQVLATTDGRVIASSPAGAYALNSRLPATAISLSPAAGLTQLNGLEANWSTTPVAITDPAGDRTAAQDRGRRVIGIAYVVVHVPEGSGKPQDKKAQGNPGIGSLVTAGVIILILLLPVGGLFGLFSTARLIRRIRRLAEGTSAMADGDLRTRIPVSGGDEVGRLEQAFNSMAERLDAALEVQRKAAGSEAQRAERARIARELHDSISQDLFSASLLAGGLRKALPPSSELRHQAESMELSLVRTMREMGAMLLELRPIALEDSGLAEALGELCRAYEARLGISISTQIDDPLWLGAPVEHAVFRVVQEAIGNAIRHGDPDAIELRVAVADGRVAVTVHDDGHGFDPLMTNGRHGMGLQLMRERINELGGAVEVLSAPERGTTVLVLLPAGAS